MLNDITISPACILTGIVPVASKNGNLYDKLHGVDMTNDQQAAVLPLSVFTV